MKKQNPPHPQSFSPKGANGVSSTARESLHDPNGRLMAKIVRNRLVISISLETLKFAAEECDGNPKVKILDAKQLAKDVISEFEDEDEVGSSMLTDLFDKAVTKAMENGSIAFADCENCKSCGETITKGATECPHCLATDADD